jgi:hypothetical protein
MPEESIPAPVEWRVIPGYKGYEASSDGQIRGIKSGRVLKPSLSRKGYQQVVLHTKHSRDNARVNIMVALTFHGEPPSSKHHAAHRDGNKSNNSPCNLKWSTAKDNMADKIAHGTASFGENHPKNKLPESVVQKVKHKLLTANSPGLAARFARELGVSKTAIYLIKTGKNWKHLL